MNNPPPNLVSAEGLLEAIFPADKRPSLRWLRQQQERRAIPYVKLGHLVFFDVQQVRSAIAERHTIRRKV